MAQIPLINKVVPDAFHGTELGKAREIERSKKFTPSTGSDKLYLGDGVYFYEGSQAYAKEWAEDKLKDQEIGVIQANIQLGRCLDMNDQKAIALIQWCREKIREKTPELDARDAAVLNWLSKMERIDTIRATFPNSSGQKIFSGSHFYRSQLVICVVNQGCIKKIALVYRSERKDGRHES